MIKITPPQKLIWQTPGQTWQIIILRKKTKTSLLTTTVAKKVIISRLIPNPRRIEKTSFGFGKLCIND